jgi:prepilin-type N-terminal cleavage/methylation domain-containing protein
MNRKNKGFTLLELMFAAAVIVVTLAGLLSTYVTCLELNETAKNTNLALSIAQRVMEEIRSTTFTSIFSTYNGYGFTVSGMASNASYGYVTVNNTNATLLNVTIGVCWKEKSSRIIGECGDVGGVFAFNGSGVLDSPVQLATLMAQR